MQKIHLSAENIAKLKRCHPTAQINQISADEYMVSGIDEKTISQFVQPSNQDPAKAFKPLENPIATPKKSNEEAIPSPVNNLLKGLMSFNEEIQTQMAQMLETYKVELNAQKQKLQTTIDQFNAMVEQAKQEMQQARLDAQKDMQQAKVDALNQVRTEANALKTKMDALENSTKIAINSCNASILSIGNMLEQKIATIKADIQAKENAAEKENLAAMAMLESIKQAIANFSNVIGNEEVTTNKK